MTEEIGKMVVVLNHDDAQSVMATLVMGAAIASSGEEVLMFFQPGAAKVLVKGDLEKFQVLNPALSPDRYFWWDWFLGSWLSCKSKTT